jgi:hypothetical protein
MPENALSYIRGLYPWLATLGVTDADLLRITSLDLPPAGIVAEIRNLPAYLEATRGLRNPDGSMRADEATYFREREAVRLTLQTYGRQGYEYDAPEDFESIFDSMGISDAASQLEQRFQAWDNVMRGGEDLREAAYVYAGIQMTDGDLYEIMVNPTRNQQFVDEYNAAAAAMPLDYDAWLGRATQAGLDRVVRRLEDLRGTGAVTDQAINQVRDLDPQFAAQMISSLYNGGENARFLSLPELMRTVEYAMIGSAATASGFELPDAERVEQFRQAGIDRQRALEGYEVMATQGNRLNSAAMRANIGTFNQTDLENAIFLRQGQTSGLMQRAEAFDEALGFQAGSARAAISQRTGLVEQTGLYGRR